MNQNKILNILSDILEIDTDTLTALDKDKNLLDLDFSSLKFITFIVAVEEEFGIEILDSDLIFDNFSTLNKITHMLKKYLSNNVFKKVLITDADNVLWRGISGEEEILIDQNVEKYHSLLSNLYERGVLLCICSKNEENNIQSALTNTSLTLNRDHFVIIKANRNDKVSNINDISDELGLSIDSFVFVDDSDYELGYVNLNLPQITTIKADFSNMTFINTISDLFDHVHDTSGLNRTQAYHDQKQREKEKHRFTTVEEYNESLETVINCEKALSSEYERIAELSQRTNQFNLSNARYTSGELERMALTKEYAIYSLSIKDKFGDMGIVGAAVVYENTIEAFMISCRAFDRGIEKHLIDKIKKALATEISGIYIRSEKNKRFENFYRDNGVKTI